MTLCYLSELVVLGSLSVALRPQLIVLLPHPLQLLGLGLLPHSHLSHLRRTQPSQHRGSGLDRRTGAGSPSAAHREVEHGVLAAEL